jgi:hypothetical protein
MEPMRTPFKSTTTITAPRMLVATTGNPYAYRRYHDALKTYLQAKRSLSHRMDLEHQEHQLTAPGDAFASSLAGQEARTELEFAKALHQQCWQSKRRAEGNLWLLLVTLRRLGLSALIWDDDARSAHQHASAQAYYLQQLAHQSEKTPKELLEEIASSSAPLGLQRLHEVVKWMQTCLDLVSIAPKSTSLASSRHPDDDVPPLLQEGQAHLLKSCLSYLLAGRLEDCKDMARAQGQSWRAAAWGGGDPEGYTRKANDQTRQVDLALTGNPNRFLWKRQCWKNGQRSAQTSPDEAAMYSYLANDVHSCFSNPSLRTWEHGLATILNSVLGRVQDQLLHWQNNNRRKCQPPPAGTEWVDQETEQLLATSTLSGMTESQMIQLLNSSPHESMRTTGVYETAVAAFLIGKSAILDFCAVETSEDFEGDEDELRFLTHLTLYLDSLHESATPIELPGLTDQKNRVLYSYVQHIQTRPDLWHMMALYVSLLPEDQLIEFYPSFLVQVTQPRERESMLEQIRELCPHVEIPVLRKVVRLALSSDIDDEAKCNSIQWLLHDQFGEALVCANILLRDFFTNIEEDKMEAAMIFVEEYLPNDLLDTANGDDEVDQAHSEYLAFVSYLNAYRTFDEWKVVLANTTSSAPSKQRDLNYLNATELAIAKERMSKDWVRDKKTKCEIIVEAAEKARQSLHEVLVFTGGWLAEDDAYVVTTSDEKDRRRELGEIRARYLALAVNLYHQVCEDTALWMSRSLDDATSVQLDRKKAFDSLKDPRYLPSHWFEHSLDLATLVAKDENGIHKNFSNVDLQEFLAKLAETAVSKLMHSV